MGNRAKQYLGHAAFFGVILVVLLFALRGCATPTQVVSKPAPKTQQGPSDEARAFAQAFTRTYLNTGPEPGESRFDDFVCPELREQIIPRVERKPDPVIDTTIAKAPPSGSITVMATTKSSVRYLSVPVQRGGSGLVICDPPAFVSGPKVGSVAKPRLQPLANSERAPIEDTVNQFFRAYLSGNRTDLSRLVDPKAEPIDPLNNRQLFQSMETPQLESSNGATRALVVSVDSLDPDTQSVFTNRYRLKVVKRDLWYVQSINPPRSEHA
jgi:hypothetical protein